MKNKRTLFHLPKFGISRGGEFGHYQYNIVAPNLKNHFHNDILEICFCLKGLQIYEVEGELHELTGNDFIIIPPNTIHSSGKYPEDIGEIYWLQISLQEENGLLCNLPENQAKELLESLKNKSNIVFQGALKMKRSLQKLQLLLQEEMSVFNSLKINQLLIQILIETYSFTEKEQLTPKKVRINQIDNYIAQHIHRVIYIDELASLIQLSTAYFKAWFKETVGMPPKVYINRKKIAQAKIDLLNEKSITKVAFNLGFSSSQYFANFFKKTYRNYTE